MKTKIRLLLPPLLILFVTFSGAQTPQYIWAKSGGNSLLSDGNIQVVNTGSGIVAAGDFHGTAHFDGEEVTSDGMSDIFLARMDETGGVIQLISFGGPDEELLRFVSIDNDGNIILSMMFTGFINFNGTDYYSFGGQDILLIKFDSAFAVTWVKHFGTGLTDYIKGMDVDDENNIMIFGKFKDQIDFDDITLTSAGSTDLYIVKFNAAGETLFAFSEGGSMYEDANALDIGANGDFFISGTFFGETVVHGQTLQTINPTGIYLAKYNAGGDFQWVEVIDGNKLIPVLFLKANDDGNIYIAGNFQKDVTFGNTTLSTGEFDQDVFVAGYHADGVPFWALQGHSSSSDVVKCIDIDIAGNVCLAGYYQAQIHFGNVSVDYSLC